MPEQNLNNRPTVLFLIPTVLGENSDDAVLPEYLKETVEKLHIFFVENIRTARRFLKHLNKARNIDETIFFELNKDTEVESIRSYLKKIPKAAEAGVLSEAGCPGIADPGSLLVAEAHRNQITVRPLVGPSSILLALMASGMNGQNFAFVGYLPIKEPERGKRIKFLENRAIAERQTQIFIETPYRNTGLLRDLFQTCNPRSRLCIAADITTAGEFIVTKTISEWKANPPEIDKKPTVFLLDGVSS